MWILATAKNAPELCESLAKQAETRTG